MMCPGPEVQASLQPRRIASFHLNQLGDLLFSLPALYNLRERFPEARVTGIVRPGCKEILLLSGLVDEVIVRPRGLCEDLRLALRLRREKTDLLLLFSTSFAAWLVAQLSGTCAKIGFTHLPPGARLARRVPWSPPPSTQNNLRLVEAIGCPTVKKDYVGLIRPGDGERDAACGLLDSAGISGGERYAVIAPGTSTGREIKCWTDEGFARVADHLAQLGLKVAVVGLGGGRRICELSRNAVDLTGKTSLPVLAAVLEQADVLIGVDSGAMHLAAAVGTRVVGLFGPSDPKITGPQGEGHRILHIDLPCHPCLAKTCDLGRRCMIGITPEMVFSAVSSVLADALT